MKRREGQAVREQETGLSGTASVELAASRQSTPLQCSARTCDRCARDRSCRRTSQDQREGRMETPGEQELVA